MPWRTVFADRNTGELVGEPESPLERRFSWRLNRLATSTMGLPLEDELADRALAGDVLAVAYEDDTVRFVGESTDAEEDVEEATKRVSATFADAGERLGTRLVGRSPTGYTMTPTGAGWSRAVGVLDLLDLANAEADTGIRRGLGTDSGGGVMRTRGYAGGTAVGSEPAGPFHYKPLAEVIAEVAGTLDGFDWEVAPAVPVQDALGLKVGVLNTYAARGALRPDAVFAYSNDREDRGNVRSYKRVVTKQGLITEGYSIPPDFPNAALAGGGVQTWSNAAAAAKWGRRMASIPSDLTVAELRLKLLQQHVAIRSFPRQTITLGGFTPGELAESVSDGRPIPYVPRFNLDYFLGDVVPFRATVDGQVRFNGLVRIYGADVAIDSEGSATTTVIVIPTD